MRRVHVASGPLHEDPRTVGIGTFHQTGKSTGAHVIRAIASARLSVSITKGPYSAAEKRTEAG